MPYENRVSIIGHLGEDCTVRYTAEGKPVVSFSMCTSKKGREGKEFKTWHKVVLFGYVAEAVEADPVLEGEAVYVQGSLQQRSWEDQEGTKRWVTEIVGDIVARVISRKKQESGASSPNQSTGANPDEDIPF